MSKSIFSYLSISVLFCALACNKPSEISPDITFEPFVAASANIIGNPIITTITANGATVSLPTAGVNITVPVGAMKVGSTLTTQTTTDPLDGQGQGLTIEGQWAKPITIEYKYDVDEPNPQFINIGVQVGSYWLRAITPKVNTTKKTVSFRLSANTEAKSLGLKKGAHGKVVAQKYSLAFAKDFYLKPESQQVDIGKSVSFTAYTKQGFIPVKYGNNVYDTESALNFVVKSNKLSDELDAADELAAFNKKYPGDEDLVPLSRYSNQTDDEVVPLAAHAKEVPFSNTKAGYSRGWEVGGNGKIVAEGINIGKYTAPNNETAKGTREMVSFRSKNNKTGQQIFAIGYAYINDGVERYLGTFSFTTIYDGNDPSLAYPTNKIKIITAEEGKLYIMKKPFTEDYVIDMQKPKSIEINQYSLNSERIASTGAVETASRNIASFPTANWGAYNADLRTLIFEKDNTYKILIKVPTEGGSFSYTFETRNGKDSGSEKFNPSTSFSTSKTAGADNIKITNIDELRGEKTWTSEIRDTASGKVTAVTTTTSKWNFVKVK